MKRLIFLSIFGYGTNIQTALALDYTRYIYANAGEIKKLYNNDTVTYTNPNDRFGALIANNYGKIIVENGGVIIKRPDLLGSGAVYSISNGYIDLGTGTTVFSSGYNPSGTSRGGTGLMAYDKGAFITGKNVTVDIESNYGHGIYADAGGSIDMHGNTIVNISGSTGTSLINASFGLVARGDDSKLNFDNATINITGDGSSYSPEGYSIWAGKNSSITSTGTLNSFVNSDAPYIIYAENTSTVTLDKVIGVAKGTGSLPPEIPSSIYAKNGSDVTIDSVNLKIDIPGYTSIGIMTDNNSSVYLHGNKSEIDVKGKLAYGVVTTQGEDGGNLVSINNLKLNVIGDENSAAIFNNSTYEQAPSSNVKLSDSTLYSSKHGIVVESGQLNVEMTNTTMINDSGVAFWVSETSNRKTALNVNASKSYFNGYSVLENTAEFNINLNNHSTWSLNGQSQATNVKNNESQIFINNHLLKVNKNYSGNSGHLFFDGKLGGDFSPIGKMMIDGNSSGTTFVSVKNIGGLGDQTINGIELIRVSGDSYGEFNQNGRIVAGAYDYSLVRGLGKYSKNWYLTSTLSSVEPSFPELKPSVIRPEVGSYISNLYAANNLFDLRLHDRLGETQYTDVLNGEEKVTSMWMRHTGGHNRFKDGSGQISTQSNRYVVQLGGDVAQWSTDGLDRWHLGLVAGHANSKSRSHSNLTGYSSRGEISGYSAGVYGTWYANNVEKTGAYVDAWMLYNWFDNTVSGEGIVSEEYDSSGITASVESGYTWKLADISERNALYIQPKAQITWMDVQADNHVERNGTNVDGKTDDNLRARLGVKVYAQGHNTIDDGKNRTFQPFVEANWIHNTSNYSVKMDDIVNKMKGARNIGEMKIGVEGKITNRMQLWVNVAQQIGNDGYSDTQGILGLKYSF